MKKMFIVLTFLLVLPLTVKATINSSALVCNINGSLIANSTFACNVTIAPDSSTPITSFKTNIIYSASDFTLTSIVPATNWTSNSTSLLNLSNANYGEGEGLVEEVMIATLKFKVSASPSYGEKIIKINGFDLTKESTDTVRIYSTNSALKSLTVAGIDFEFSSNTKVYSLETTKSSISINAIPYDSRAILVSGYGSRVVNLNYGSNPIQIIVKAENGSTSTYTLNVTRKDQRSSNNYLASLSISEGTLSPNFNKNTLVYQSSVSNNVNSVTINASLESETASFVSDYGPRTVSLQNGLNSFSLQVKAENGTTKIYTINIIKIEKKVNNYLKSITLSNGNIVFDKNKLQYNINVLYNVLEMNVIAIPEDEKSKVEVVGNKSLVLGANTFTIKVTSESGSVLTYTIVVNRLEEGRELSSNNYLEELIISNYPIDFNKDILDYSIKIKKEDRLTISFSSEDTNSKTEIIGNNALKNGSIIKIKVTSEDGKARTYNINISKDLDFSSYWIYISSGLVIIIIVLLLIFKDKIFKPKDKQLISKDLKLGGSKLVLGHKKTSKEQELTKEPEVVIIPEEDNK